VDVRETARSSLEVITLVGVLSPPFTTLALTIVLLMGWLEFRHPAVSLVSGATILFFVSAVVLAHFLQPISGGGPAVRSGSKAEGLGRRGAGEHRVGN